MKIGVKRKYWFGYHWHTVGRINPATSEMESYYFRAAVPAKNHEAEIERAGTSKLWLVLKLSDGRDLVYTDIETRSYILPPVDTKELAIVCQPQDSEESANA